MNQARSELQLCQLVLGRFPSRFPVGVASRICFATLFWDILDTWPNQCKWNLSILKSGSIFRALRLSWLRTSSQIVRSWLLHRIPISANVAIARLDSFFKILDQKQVLEQGELEKLAALLCVKTPNLHHRMEWYRDSSQWLDSSRLTLRKDVAIARLVSQWKIQDSNHSHFYKTCKRLVDKHSNFIHKQTSIFASVAHKWHIGANFLTEFLSGVMLVLQDQWFYLTLVRSWVFTFH